jgi:hypothetical protein
MLPTSEIRHVLQRHRQSRPTRRLSRDATKSHHPGTASSGSDNPAARLTPIAGDRHSEYVQSPHGQTKQQLSGTITPQQFHWSHTGSERGQDLFSAVTNCGKRRRSLARVDDLANTVADRSGWTMIGNVGVYAASPHGWSARVTYTTMPGRTYQRLHIAIIDPSGVARYTMFASTTGEAIRVAETQVHGRAGD